MRLVNVAVSVGQDRGQFSLEEFVCAGFAAAPFLTKCAARAARCFDRALRFLVCAKGCGVVAWCLRRWAAAAAGRARAQGGRAARRPESKRWLGDQGQARDAVGCHAKEDQFAEPRGPCPSLGGWHSGRRHVPSYVGSFRQPVRAWRVTWGPRHGMGLRILSSIAHPHGNFTEVDWL